MKNKKVSEAKFIMYKYIAMYYYNSESIEEIDVLAVCDTFDEAREFMEKDYEEFVESFSVDKSVSFEKYRTLNEAKVKTESVMCFWKIMRGVYCG